MVAVLFDTLKLARRLESAGFPPKQAGDTAAALAEAISGGQLATGEDVAGLRAELKAEIAAVRSEIAALRTELKADIAALRTELKADIAAVRAELRADIEVLRRDMTIRLGGMMIVAVGIILAAIRYLPPAR